MQTIFTCFCILGWIAKTARRKIHSRTHAHGWKREKKPGTVDETPMMNGIQHNSVLRTQIALSHVPETTSLRASNVNTQPLNLDFYPFPTAFSLRPPVVSCTQLGLEFCRQFHSPELHLIDWLCLTFHFSCIPHLFVFLCVLFSIYQTILSLFLEMMDSSSGETKSMQVNERWRTKRAQKIYEC